LAGLHFLSLAARMRSPMTMASSAKRRLIWEMNVPQERFRNLMKRPKSIHFGWLADERLVVQPIQRWTSPTVRLAGGTEEMLAKVTYRSKRR
jgi:hypothetical protein